MKKSFIQAVLAGITGGVGLGIVLFLSLANYGANSCDQISNFQSCSCFCCDLFGVRGYESCGTLGIYLGFLLGGIIGVTILYLAKKLFKIFRRKAMSCNT